MKKLPKINIVAADGLTKTLTPEEAGRKRIPRVVSVKEFDELVYKHTESQVHAAVEAIIDSTRVNERESYTTNFIFHEFLIPNIEKIVDMLMEDK